jgi:enterochelin esterase-like enzyme
LVISLALAALLAVPSTGRVAEYQLTSSATHVLRKIWAYTPPGYTARDSASYDLLIVFDGAEYLDEIPLPAILDSLIAAKRIPPIVAVLMDNGSSSARLADLANHESFAKYMGDEFMPWVRRNWRVTHDPHRTFITGSSAGGLAAAFVALHHPELFGNVLSQSGAFWRGAEGSNGAPFEWVTSLVGSEPKRDVRFFLDVGALETHGAIGGTAPSILDANRRLRDALRAKGYAVNYTEVPGGAHAPEFWKLRLPVGLVTLAGNASATK